MVYYIGHLVFKFSQLSEIMSRKVNYLGEKPTNLKEASHLKGLKAKKNLNNNGINLLNKNVKN